MTRHTAVSLVKSIIRILGFFWFFVNPSLAVIILIVAEVIGIIEEI